MDLIDSEIIKEISLNGHTRFGRKHEKQVKMV